MNAWTLFYWIAFFLALIFYFLVRLGGACDIHRTDGRSVDTFAKKPELK